MLLESCLDWPITSNVDRPTSNQCICGTLEVRSSALKVGRFQWAPMLLDSCLELPGNFQRRTSNVELPTSNFQRRTSNIERPTSNVQRRTSNFQPMHLHLHLVGC